MDGSAAHSCRLPHSRYGSSHDSGLHYLCLCSRTSPAATRPCPVTGPPVCILVCAALNNNTTRLRHCFHCCGHGSNPMGAGRRPGYAAWTRPVFCATCFYCKPIPPPSRHKPCASWDRLHKNWLWTLAPRQKPYFRGIDGQTHPGLAGGTGCYFPFWISGNSHHQPAFLLYFQVKKKPP